MSVSQIVGVLGVAQLNDRLVLIDDVDHEELWQPAWGIRTGESDNELEMEANSDYLATAIIGLQGFFTLKGQEAMGVGSIEYPVAERKRLARL